MELIEAVAAGRFLPPGKPLGRQFREQPRQSRAPDDHVMSGENRPDFVFTALRKEKLAPGKHICSLQQNHFESSLTLGRRDPSIATVYRPKLRS